MKKEDEYAKLVWSDQKGDLRSKKPAEKKPGPVDKSGTLHLRRMTAGKGRPVIQITNLTGNDDWCKKLASDIKSKLACGGTYKNGVIEIHGEQFEKLTAFLDNKGLKWKKNGG